MPSSCTFCGSNEGQKGRSSFYFIPISRSLTIHWWCIAVGLSDVSPSLIQEVEKEEDAHSSRVGGRKSNEYIVSKAFPERGKFDRSADNNVMAQCKKNLLVQKGRWLLREIPSSAGSHSEWNLSSTHPRRQFRYVTIFISLFNNFDSQSKGRGKSFLCVERDK